MEPLFFEPYFREQIWGGRRLADVLGKPLPPEGRFGESWEISAHRLHVTKVKEGPFAGLPLDLLWQQNAHRLWGDSSAPTAFPWLFKFLDCDDYLSVQVHPDDAVAAECGLGEPGKYEVWVIVDAAPSGRVFAGLRPGVCERDLTRALESGSVREVLFEIVPQKGDVLVMPPGTVHTAGGGVLIAEVQTPSDATFRLFDWNRRDRFGRPRPLHVKEALRAIRWDMGPCEPVRSTNVVQQGSVTEEVLVQGPSFTLRRWWVPPGASITLGTGALCVWQVLVGRGVLETGSGVIPMKSGDTALIPGSCLRAEWTTLPGEVGVLLACHRS